MLFVADKSTVVRLNKRTRSLPSMAKALGTAQVPQVFIFNVGPRLFTVPKPQGTYRIPACPTGKSYSDALAIDGLVLSEYDLGDSGGAMGTTADPGLDSVTEEGERLYGVADDIIGKHSTAAALDLFTTNLEWFGVFSSATNPPQKGDVAAAQQKLKQMMQLIYAKGSELVQTGQPVPTADRKNYNEAAEFLGARPLWGDQEHLMARCPECRETVIEGATFCKHCQQAIDPSSVSSRAAKRAKANKEDAN